MRLMRTHGAFRSSAQRMSQSTRSGQLYASVLGIAAILVLGGCIGEPALDEQLPMSLSIKTPELEGQIVFSDKDAVALDLSQRNWDVRSVGDRGSTSIPTGLTQSASDRTEYCFGEPVTLVSPTGSERLLIQPGECFGGSATTMDRAGVRFTSPLPGAVVGDLLEVQVADEVGIPESQLRFLVEGELLTATSEAEGRATLDLSGVDTGPVSIRVEVVDPGGWIRAASVIEVVKEDTAG